MNESVAEAIAKTTGASVALVQALAWRTFGNPTLVDFVTIVRQETHR